MIAKKTASFLGGGLFVMLMSLSLAGCVTTKKVDAFISAQYGDRIPPVVRRKADDIKISSSLPQKGDQLSSTVKTSKTLPLILYWQGEYKTTSTLNTEIPVNQFTNTLLSMARRKLVPKLNGRRLELSLDEVPHSFTLDDKEHLIWLVYAINWSKLSMQPSGDDMVVTYKLTDNGTTTQTGKITVHDAEKPMPIGLFRTWKNATSTYISRYDDAIKQMSLAVVDQLERQL